MRPSKDTPWLLVGGDLRRDAPYFVSLGLVFSITQFAGYDYFGGANLGGDLLQEHLALRSVAISIMFLWAARAVLEWQRGKRKLRYLEAMVANVANRTVGFASVGASIVFGFAIMPAILGAYWHAGMFLLCSFYIACLAEVAANPLLGKGGSRAHDPAFAVLVVIPFAL